MTVIYSDRTCPICGTVFTPKHKRQIYDHSRCRTKASRQHHNEPEVSLAISNHAEYIQRNYPMVADAMHQLFNKYGRQFDVDWTLVVSNAIQQAERAGKKRRTKKI